MFVSCGKDQLNFWTVIGNTIKKKKGLFGNVKNVTTMFCLAFSEIDKEIVYTGTLNGQIYVWKDSKLKEILPSVHTSSIFQITKFNDGFVTGGKDGVIKTWDAKFHEIENIPLMSLMNSNSPDYFLPNNLIIRSLNSISNKLLIGTQSSEIYEIDLDKDDLGIKCFCKGHAQGELWALAASPLDPKVIATASDDKTLRVWDLNEKKLLKITELESKIRSCAFSADGKHIACGLSEGKLVIVNVDDMTPREVIPKSAEVLHEMKYSPDGKFLAAGSNDMTVYIMSVTNYKKQVAKCKGNSSSITHLDWSKDSQFIMTNSADGAKLIFKAESKFEVFGLRK